MTSRIRLEYFSKDPIGFGAGDANLYRYVENQSTTSTDPSGLAQWDHTTLLRENTHWTYGKHAAVVTFPNVDAGEVMDHAFELLKSFAHFNSDIATVRVYHLGDDSFATFNLLGTKGFLSDVLNDNEVFVDIEQTGQYELTATTRGAHQLIGIRKWRVRRLSDHSPNCPTIVIETEADERVRGLNSIAEWPIVSLASRVREDMKEIWRGYIQRTADAVANEYNGKASGVAITGPTKSGPRFNRFRPGTGATIGRP